MARPPSTAHLLDPSGPAGESPHVVQFYETDEYLCQTIAGFAGAGLKRGEPAVVIATAPHRSVLRARLAAGGVDVERAIAAGELILLDAAGTLSEILVGGMPDADRFAASIGGLFETVRARHPDRSIRAYGEMVDLLWQAGQRSAALSLETMWNELARVHPFSLLCAYVMGNFYKSSDQAAFDEICRAHTHVFPAEPTEEDEPAEPRWPELRAIAARARSLEHEVAHRKELELALREALREREQVERERADALARAEARERRSELLVKASIALAETLDYQRTLRRVAELAVPEMADWCTVAVRDESGTLERAAVVHRDERLRAIALAYEHGYPPDAHRAGDQLSTVQRCKGVLHRQVTDEELQAAAQDEHHLEILRALGCTSCILVPMVLHGKPLGVISLMISDSSRQFDDEDLKVAEELARRAAVAIDNARLYREAGRREEEKRRQSERRLQLLIESIKDYAVFMLDPKGLVTTWTPAAEVIEGYLADEILGKHFSIFYPEEDVLAGKCEMELEQAALTGRFEDLGWRVRKDGTRYWANIVLSAIKDESGRLVGFAKVARDLTERKRVEEEQTARLAAEQANRAKDEFLAMLGHELRNPLAPIVTAIQLMKLRGDVRSSHEQQIIERQVQHMVRLVDDLLDVSRITRGRIDLKKQTIDLRDAVARAVEIASPLLEQRRHHFQVEVPPHELRVFGDEARLAQVFANLLTNAAKYTEPRGHVAIDVKRVGGEVLVQVRDDGVGIPPELLPRIFDLFVQGQQSAERSSGGLGIGLNLVRTLVDLHGGRVDATSAGRGAGSSFTVTLPLAAAPPETELADPPPAIGWPQPSRLHRILVVDDNEDALELVAEVLRTIGHEVRTATDGAIALACLEGFVPDVAILDIGLPVMDGYELAARLRAELGAAPLQLIALTGYGQQSDRARSGDAGFDTHLVKPIDTQKLLDALEELPQRA